MFKPHGRRPSDLAEEAGMSRQAMNYLLGQLEALDYIIREDDPDDLRSKRVHYTKRGEELRDTIRQSVGSIERKLKDELGPSAYTQLRHLLVELNNTTVVQRPVTS